MQFHGSFVSLSLLHLGVKKNQTTDSKTTHMSSHILQESQKRLEVELLQGKKELFVTHNPTY